ncbi:hypothetical protein MKK55_13040 [Methylobacterium sp. J-059]|uniref:hypothetical protein n=1 Tax=Methylobacterium sp. J-059 TaxID=2836643 RepID=UPI001FB98F2F|nr:hypothetical protein [Methylobacterium sp. J-059]MCJ2039855.1 hypothetical protein [Methylobacterium sp. J-059]
MDWTSLAGQLAQIGLPALGTLFGGPLGGTVGAMVGKGVAAALGVAPTPEAVSAAVQADPNGAAVKLAEIEAETKRQDAYLADLANARAMEVQFVQAHSPIAWGPVVVSVMNYALLGAIVLAVGMGWLREDGIIVGFALGAASSVYQYWLGSSESSKRNADAVRQFALNSNTPTAGQVAQTAIQAIRRR